MHLYSTPRCAPLHNATQWKSSENCQGFYHKCAFRGYINFYIVLIFNICHLKGTWWRRVVIHFWQFVNRAKLLYSRMDYNLLYPVHPPNLLPYSILSDWILFTHRTDSTFDNGLKASNGTIISKLKKVGHKRLHHI